MPPVMSLGKQYLQEQDLAQDGMIASFRRNSRIFISGLLPITASGLPSEFF